MTDLFLTLLNMSITASYIALAVMLFRLLFKKAPKWIRCSLWGLVALRLISPISFESILSLIPSAQTVPPDIVYSDTPAITSGIPALNSTVNPIISDTFAPDPTQSITPLQTVTAWATVLWLAGMIAMALYVLISTLRLKHRVRERSLLQENIYLCDRIETPFILGIFRPKIYLPSFVDESTARYVIAHEKAHIRRLDHFWKPLGFSLLTVYWFNPLLWVAYVLLCRDIELACDERVIQNMEPQQIKAYSTALLNLSAARRAIAACPLAFGETGVKGRIKSLLHYKKPAFWLMVTALVLSVVIGVCFLTNPITGIDPVDDSDLFVYPNQYFKATEVVYQDGSFSYLISPESSSQYQRRGDQLFYRSGGENTAWHLIGSLEETTLTRENFNTRFQSAYWGLPASALSFRKSIINAWEVKIPGETTGDNVFYLLLRHKSGDYYLAFGYYDNQSLANPKNSDKTFVRWMIRTEHVEGLPHGATNQIPDPGTIQFYDTPTPEDTVPVIAYTNTFENRSTHDGFFDLLKQQTWLYDGLIERVSFTFDGRIYWNGTWLYFGYEQSVVYCEEHVCYISRELMERVRAREKTAVRYDAPEVKVNPSFTGVVKEVLDGQILVTVTGGSGGGIDWGEAYVSTTPLHQSTAVSVSQGELVRVVYNGEVRETYPMQIPTVFNIFSLGYPSLNHEKFSQYNQATALYREDPANHRDIGELQIETTEILQLDDRKYYQSYVDTSTDLRYVFVNNREASLGSALWDFVPMGTASDYSAQNIGKTIDEQSGATFR